MPQAQSATGSTRLSSSFRDPAAFVFRRGDTLYRQLHPQYLRHYRALMDSGLAAELQTEQLLLRHKEVDLSMAADPATAGCVIKPEVIPFISYPWEWTFAGLKDAALLTLSVLDRALKHGMILKDASARNVQFIGTRPVFIDTASFEIHDGGPWMAYKQFCEHFLAPLALMAYGTSALRGLQQTCTDGIPLRDAVRILPLRARLSPRLLLHCFGHVRFIKQSRNGSVSATRKTDVRRLAESLRLTIEGLSLPKQKSLWASYDPHTFYGESVEKKKNGVAAVVRDLKPALTWDIASNDGLFSRLMAGEGTSVIAMEYDTDAVERCYELSKGISADVLPLFFDFNSQGSSGLLGEEMPSVFDRRRPDLVVMLGLLHHLCVTQNIPLSHIAAFCRKAGTRHVLAEWIDPHDERAARVLQAKPIRHHYDRSTFIGAFAGWTLVREEKISDTRSLVLFSA